MINNRTSRGANWALLFAVIASSSPLGAQSVARRVASAPEGRVQFSFPARPGICGNGRSYIQTGPNSYSGSWVGDDARRMDPCVAGPVRVVLDRADRNVISLQTYVGPPSVDPGTTDLGSVGAEEAADYLFSLAREAEGRVGREAIMPAMLADAGNTSAELLAIGRDPSRPRETRRSALTSEAVEFVMQRLVSAMRTVSHDLELSQLLTLHNGSRLTALDLQELYLERCRRFFEAPRPESWDGVAVYHDK